MLGVVLISLRWLPIDDNGFYVMTMCVLHYGMGSIKHGNNFHLKLMPGYYSRIICIAFGDCLMVMPILENGGR